MIKKWTITVIDWMLIKLGPDLVKKNNAQPEPRLLGEKSISIEPIFSASKIPDAEKPWPPKNPMWPPKNHMHKDSPRA